MKRILAADLAILDYIANKGEIPAVDEFAAQPNIADRMKENGKAALSAEEYAQFKRALGVTKKYKISPGGSSANTLTTLGKMLPDDVRTDFMSVVGKDDASQAILKDFEQANIRFIQPASKIEPETAVSFVSQGEKDRHILTYPGNAREILTPSALTHDMVEQSDILFVQGSLWQKLDLATPVPEGNPGWAEGDITFADKLMRLRGEMGKELWLALPTHAKFGEEKRGLFQFLIPSATVVMGNVEELCRVAGSSLTPEQVGRLDAPGASLRDVPEVEVALKQLQQKFINGRDAHHFKGERQVAFITLSSQGSAVVTAEGIEYVPIAKLRNNGPLKKLGAGDASYAGFAAGYLKGLPLRDCARMGMEIAGAKLGEEGPRVSRPLEALQERAPDLYDALMHGPTQQMQVERVFKPALDRATAVG